MCAAAGLGVIFTNISEFLLFKEARAHYLPKACRYMNEAIMGFASLFMLAGTITATVIVMNHSANIYSNGKLVPTATIAPAAKALGLSLAYKDFTCYYASALSHHLLS